MSNNQNSVIEIAGKHLGKVGGEGYKATYDPELLVAIPRHLNREAYGINEGDLPFIGGTSGMLMKYLQLLPKDFLFRV